MVKQQLFIGAALLAGVAIGYFVQPRQAAETEVIEEPTVAAPKAVLPDVGDAASIAALRARIKDLESQLAAREVERVDEEPTERREARRNQRGEGGGMFNAQARREWVENLKKNNPQAYTAMTNGIATANRNRLERNQKKLDFFSSIDTSRMSASAKATHDALQDLIVRRETLEDSQVDWANLSDEEMRSQIDKRREIEREISRLSEIERKNLIQEAGKELGLQGENAAGFAETIQEIYDATETPGWWNRGGRNNSGRGGRGRR